MSMLKKAKFICSIVYGLSFFFLIAHDQLSSDIPTHSTAAASSLKRLHIIGGGVVGALAAYNEFKNNSSLCITIYEKNKSLMETTATNIAPSLTPDEILAVVPRGPELVKKSQILFSQPGGIRVDDVPGINNTEVTKNFQKEVQLYSFDETGHYLRTQCLLALGKLSMDLWQTMYEKADDDLKKILEESNFNPCYEPIGSCNKALHKGYRIDLIYNIPNAKEKALAMQQDYQALGYKQCTILSPTETMAIDPFLKGFCLAHSQRDSLGELQWHNDAIALWRPGGCIDAQAFLPKLYDYLKRKMGVYIDEDGIQKDCFQIKFGHKVTGLDYIESPESELTATGLHLETENGTIYISDKSPATYILCPGEAVGTLKALGLSEPAYAGFAGASLRLIISIPKDKQVLYKTFNHCMEVHQEGVVLAWQARFNENSILISVAGTKAFYSDQQPTKDQEFAKNRNLLQLTMINDVLPEFISLALNRNTKGETLTEKDLCYLESQGIATRWAGTRAVAYDGFPSLGNVYRDGKIVNNVTCITHLGSGGVSFSLGSILANKGCVEKNSAHWGLIDDVLLYANSARASSNEK